MSEQAAPTAPDRILRRPEVEARTGLSRSTIYRRMNAGTFPRARDLGGNTVGWYESAINNWIAERPQASGTH